MIIQIYQANILTADTQAIVNPANSLGVMEHEIAAAIKAAGGNTIEDAARKQSPISIGNAVITTAGDLPFEGIIHAPIMKHPEEPIPAKQVELATMAALRAADEAGYVSIGFPALGTSKVADVDPETAAKIMVETIQMYIPDNQLELVKIFVQSEEVYEAFKKYV